MSISKKLDNFHWQLRSNVWMRRFTIFTRIILAAGFIPSGLQKVLGERFTSLVVNHPMGHYLDALYQTGYYYTTIGIFQVVAAILLLIPRTATLGVIVYFPIILNICILSLSVRFDGSLVTAPLMTFACLYLFFWDYHKFKFILPFKKLPARAELPTKNEMSRTFPVKFLSIIFGIAVSVILLTQLYEIMPRNTSEDCAEDCKTNENPEACLEFCDCIHEQGKPLDNCLEAYKRKR